MQVSTVSAGNETANAAAAKPSTEEFKGHYVVKGQVQRTWGEALTRSDISSLQTEYEEANAPKSAKDEGYSLMTPFNFVGGIISSVFGFLGTMVSSILGVCGYGGEGAAEAEGTAKAEDKAEAKKA
ncbi:MAG: hypothetical protein P0S96_00600 [Simkaniaceae bacterium]|nr:hypothetical protein [Candidatus Sacchlamyda saccharinae]